MQRPDDLEAVFKEGMGARDAGSTLADNPYSVKTAEHREWAAGWSATFDLDEEDDPESMRVKDGDLDCEAGTDPAKPARS